MSKRTLIALVFSFLIIVALVIIYENHLTRGFRDSCITLLDSDKLSDEQATLYIQNLHSEARTFRDGKVLSELERAVHLMRDAEKRDDPYIQADVDYGYGLSCEDLKKPRGQRQFSDDFDTQRCNEETAAKDERDKIQPEHDKAENERKEASILMRKFYSDLGAEIPANLRNIQ